MKMTHSPRALDHLEHALKRRLKESRKKRYHYCVPSLWTSPGSVPKIQKTNPFAYYLDVVKKVKRVRTAEAGKTYRRRVDERRGHLQYVRPDNDGVRSQPERDAGSSREQRGFRETGTFLKAMAMLPYIKRLGANTVHLLPITSIGHDGNKGITRLAVCHPQSLRAGREPRANRRWDSTCRTEFKAFVEAAHRLGLRVVVEFVFRTAAKDADWVKEHPEWFYWIKDPSRLAHPHAMDEARYGSPLFTPEELERIHHDVNAGQPRRTFSRRIPVSRLLHAAPRHRECDERGWAVHRDAAGRDPVQDSRSLRRLAAG